MKFLINRSIVQGIYPNSWKRGEWVPLHKKNIKTDNANYSPVTVLNAVNKVVEQQLSNQTFICLLIEKKDSRETALLKLVKDWSKPSGTVELDSFISISRSIPGTSSNTSFIAVAW